MSLRRSDETGNGREGRLAALVLLVVVASIAQLFLMQRNGAAMQSSRLGSSRHTLRGTRSAVAALGQPARPWQLAAASPARTGVRVAAAPAMRRVGATEAASIPAVQSPGDPADEMGERAHHASSNLRRDPHALTDGGRSGLETAVGASVRRVMGHGRPGYDVITSPAAMTDDDGDAVEPVEADEEAETTSELDASSEDTARIGPDDPGAWLDRDGRGTQLMVLGPVTAHTGEVVSFPILVDGARGIAHAPVRVQFNPDLLEYVDAVEGPFLSQDGAGTEFIAQPGLVPGEVHVALSRMPPSRGISGSGTLFTVRFLALSEGETPIATTGSSLLDDSGQLVALRRSDSHVAIQ